METGAKQDLTRLGINTQIELLKRQLSEWRILLRTQRQLRHCTQKEPIGLEDSTESMALFRERANQLNQLSLLSVRQSQERQELHLRHQQQIVELDRVSTAQQPGLANR